MAKDVDDVVRSMSRDRASGDDEGQLLTPPEGQVVDPGSSEEDAMANLFSHVPPEEGYYIKVYRRAPVPKEHGNRPVFLADISNPDLIVDIDSEILKLAKQHGWCDGVYEAKLFKQDVPGIQAWRRVAIQVPVPATAPTSPDGTPIAGAADPLQSITQALKVLKEFYGPVPSGGSVSPDPAAIVKAVTEAYRAGVETQVRKEGDHSSDTLLAMARVLKELAPPSTHTPGSELIPLLKELGLIHRPAPAPAPDLVGLLVKLKELLPPPKAEEDRTDKTLDLVTRLVPLLQSLSGGTGEAPSAVVELIRAVAPQAGQMVTDITTTINNAIAAKTGNPVRQPPRAVVAPVPELPPQQELPMLPVFQAIKTAAESNDVAFFPQLEQLLRQITTHEQFDQIIARQLSADTILDQVRQWGGDFFVTPTAKVYFENYITWAGQRKASVVVGACDKCGVDYEFESKEEFDKEHTCPECKEELRLVS